MSEHKKSKKPLIITAVVLAAAIIAAIVILLVLRQNKQAASPDKQASAAETVQTTEAETGVPHQHEEETTPDILIPTEAGGTVTHFSATFKPNGEVTDLSTGKSVTLREVFGSSYASGQITFNEDRTFTDTLNGLSGASTGMYNVENGKIKAIYSNDKNMDITVTKWNDDKTVPEEFSIIYGDPETGYKVYF